LSGSPSYQWLVDSIVVGTGDHLKVTSGFIGKSILVMASYTDGWGKQEQVISDKTQPVISAGLVLTGTKYADVLTGGKYNDQISGLSGNDILSSKNGADIVKGGTGNDILIGGLGKDALYGGLGNDTFRYESILDSKVSQADDIFDFKIGDKIDLTAIDANLLKTGNQAFKELVVGDLFKGFINSASLFFDKSTHILYGNIDSDSKPEFSISLLGVNKLVFENIIA
jgi:Ca2+-binding RTX toxin-like protein